MHISPQNLKTLCHKKKLRLKDLLTKAGVSKTAFYSLLRKDSVLPRSIHALAKALGENPSALLEEGNAEVKRIRDIAALTDKIMVLHPEADRDNIRHTLLLLREPPIERLKRGILRASQTHLQ